MVIWLKLMTQKVGNRTSRNVQIILIQFLSKKFEQGRFSLPYKSFLGYDRGEDGMPVINEKQAVIVREIFQRYLAGQSPLTIAHEFEKKGYSAPCGGSRWSQTTINSILRNEKYCGDAILQKRYTLDFLTKKRVQNNGELPKYYVTGSHEAIVSKEVFDLVQAEIASRKGKVNYNATIFSGKVVCGKCGSFYGSKLWHSTDKYRRVIYRCNRKYEGCGSEVHLTEDELKDVVVKALNSYLDNREDVITNLESLMVSLYSVDALERELSSATTQIAVSKEMYTKALQDKPLRDGTQLSGIKDIYVKALDKKKKLEEEIARRKNCRLQLESICTVLREADKFVAEFSPFLFISLVEKVVVYAKEDVRVTFRDGREVGIGLLS